MEFLPRYQNQQILSFLFCYLLLLISLVRETPEEITKKMVENEPDDVFKDDKTYKEKSKHLNTKTVYLVLNNLPKDTESSKSGTGMFPIPRIG